MGRWLAKTPGILTLSSLIALHSYCTIRRLKADKNPKDSVNFVSYILDSYLILTYLLTGIALVANLFLLLLICIASLTMLICQMALTIIGDVIYLCYYGIIDDYAHFFNSWLYVINWIVFIYIYKKLAPRV